MAGALSSAIRRCDEVGRYPLIADIKPVSPRDGDLLRHRSPGELARALDCAGACALSVVTESRNFGGSLAMLREVASAVDIPVLRKDFLEHPDQVDETAAYGGQAVLLTLATIPPELLESLYQRTLETGVEAVVEVHTAAELKRALALCPAILGINNRDLLTLEKDAGDVRVTETLAPLVPDGIVMLSESSLLSAGDIARALAAGADAVLVGTAILQADDLSAHIRALFSVARRALGGEFSP